MPQIDSAADCARVLLALTKEWLPGDGSAATVTDARAMLASMIYKADGKGFPAPVSEDVAKQPSLRENWKACLTAARAALDESGIPRAPVAENVVFWVPDPNSPTKLGDAAGLGLSWPFQPGSNIIRSSGPILDGSDRRPKRLFFFDKFAKEAAIEFDADARPGFWPRGVVQNAAASQSVISEASFDNATSRPSLATALFALWVLSGATLAIWLWMAARAMGNATSKFKGSACLSAPNGWTADCSKDWSAELHAQLTTAGDKISNWIGNLLWTISGDGPHLMMLVPFILTMGSILLLMLAAGLATKGLWFGVLIDERNRISLSRAQQVAWTVLLLAALAIMGWCNAAAFSTANPAAQSAWSLFPTVPGALWAALGINLVVTPYLSNVILKLKDPQRQAGERDEKSKSGDQQSDRAPTVVQASLDTNESPAEAAWADLITGETVGTERQLNLSRIQNVVISGTLLTSYFIVLANQLGDVAGVVTAFTGNSSIFSAMPPVDGGNTTFLGLLGLSQAGYLWFKAKEPEGTGEGRMPQSQASEAGK